MAIGDKVTIKGKTYTVFATTKPKTTSVSTSTNTGKIGKPIPSNAPDVHATATSNADALRQLAEVTQVSDALATNIMTKSFAKDTNTKAPTTPQPVSYLNSQERTNIGLDSQPAKLPNINVYNPLAYNPLTGETPELTFSKALDATTSRVADTDIKGGSEAQNPTKTGIDMTTALLIGAGAFLLLKKK